jgi:hypothetical protein
MAIAPVDSISTSESSSTPIGCALRNDARISYLDGDADGRLRPRLNPPAFRDGDTTDVREDPARERCASNSRIRCTKPSPVSATERRSSLNAFECRLESSGSDNL